MIKQIYKDRFIKENSIFFIGTLIISVLNYLYHPVLGRMMSVESFGEIQTLIALFTIFGIIIRVYRIIVINIISNTENIQEKQDLILMLNRSGLYLILSIFILIVVSSSLLKDFLNFNSFYPFISLAVLLVISLLSNLRGAILHGVRNFKAVSIAGIITAFFRLAFAIVFVYIGWSSFGAITGLVMAQALSWLYVIYKTKDNFALKVVRKINITSKIKNELKYGLLILISRLSINFIFIFDIILIKHFYSPEEAGLYGGIATIARIIFYLTGSVAGVLLPSIKMNNKPIENRKILIKAGIILAFIGGGSLIIFSTLSNFVISVFIGDRYLELSYLLPKLSLTMFIASIINLLFFYYIALRKYFIISISIIAPTVIIGLTYWNHDSLMQVVNNFLIGSILVLAFLFFRYFISKIPRSNHFSINQ